MYVSVVLLEVRERSETNADCWWKQNVTLIPHQPNTQNMVQFSVPRWDESPQMAATHSDTQQRKLINYIYSSTDKDMEVVY